ncbi:sporulation protein [uncultured Endozoicomonas sp.]|uniref:sporulation protein n=1 Tax=uncultured Endozoicomonas sp. TaxID=432652 RepID=UPI002609DC5D|nr:sporulation protein [uncultured Endozoicomonas sp.]
MSLLKKAMASLSIGAAKVDAVLKQPELVPGERVDFNIYVKGGSIEQQIDNIYLDICCQYFEEIERNKGNGDESVKEKVKQVYSLSEWSLPESFIIAAGEERVFKDSFTLPWNTPITLGEGKVWLETGLDIQFAIDPSDTDLLVVRPDPLLRSLFEALMGSGLQLRQAECEAAKGFELPFVQEFEFVPVSGKFLGRWRELEVVAWRDEKRLKLWFEVDRQQRGLSGMLSSLLGRGELKRHLEISADASPADLGQQVIAFLDQTT